MNSKAGEGGRERRNGSWIHLIIIIRNPPQFTLLCTPHAICHISYTYPPSSVYIYTCRHTYTHTDTHRHTQTHTS